MDETPTDKDICCKDTYADHRIAGTAVIYSYVEDGVMWIGNGEYENECNYCPFCGRKADRDILAERNAEMAAFMAELALNNPSE